MNNETTERTKARSVPCAVTSSFECDVTYLDDWACITARGGLDVSTVPALRRMVLAAAVLPISGVILDLAGVDSVDRYAVDALVAASVGKCAIGTPRLRSRSISPPARRALDVAGVGDLFDQEGGQAWM